MKGVLKEQKSELRRRLLLIRDEIPEEEKQKASISVTNRFISLASFRFAETILLYYPIKGELDTVKIAEAALKTGKRIAFPLCNDKDSTMTYHYVSSLDELVSGTYGIPEPKKDAPLYQPSPDKHDIIIVPAVGFDKEGYRIGYGRGYYDRYLSSFGGTAIGITYHSLLMPSLPRGRFDKKVDLILTERGAYST